MTSRLCEAALNGDLATLETLLAEGVDVNEIDEGYTAIICALLEN